MNDSLLRLELKIILTDCLVGKSTHQAVSCHFAARCRSILYSKIYTTDAAVCLTLFLARAIINNVYACHITGFIKLQMWKN